MNYIRSEWIRPEDLHIYEELGYDLFKIAERDIPTSVMVSRVKAYGERRYEGNLLDLIQPFGFNAAEETRGNHRGGLGWLLKYFFRPGLVNPARLLLLKRLADMRSMTRPAAGDGPVYIDNRALSGFSERFREKGCKDEDCKECRWCHEFAEKAVRIDEAHRQRVLRAYGEIFTSLHEGDMWRYLYRTRGD